MKPWALESLEAGSYGLRREVLSPTETLVFVDEEAACSRRAAILPLGGRLFFPYVFVPYFRVGPDVLAQQRNALFGIEIDDLHTQ